jgi:hypothetical protein
MRPKDDGIVETRAGSLRISHVIQTKPSSLKALFGR